MSGVVASFVWILLAYLVVVNGMYLVLHFLAVRTVREKVTLRPLENLPPVQSALVPPVSIIVTARDDEAGAVDRVRAALAMDYPQFEVVVVNDGSRDATLDKLREAFALEAFPEVYWRRIPVKPVRTIYHSRLHRNLRVVDKERGGTADAINAGVNTSRYPLFIHLDPRWTLRRGGLRILAEPFVDDPGTVAVCCTVRIDPDGSGALETGPAELPPRLFSRLQIVEHLREPLFGRLGWARLNAALAVSGSAILFRKDTVIEATGFRGDMLVEEMELVTRLHKVWRATGERYVVDVVPEPICWARPAGTLGQLREQRMRWQVGLAQAMAANPELFRVRHGGAVRWLAYPFLSWLERFGPAVEVLGLALVAAMFLLKLVPGMVLVAFLVLTFALGFLVSMSALVLEDVSYRMYPRWGQAARLAIAAVVENLGYRQLVAFWRFDALLRWWQTRG
ncbi:MAG TPA: glycosyltransferase [Usitatibacter sp.]|nr:glycosyltransferase [Usitatibacter sp.]